MKNEKDLLIRRKKYLQDILAGIDAKYSEMPDGSVFVARRKGKPQFYLRGAPNSSGLCSDASEISKKACRPCYVKKADEGLVRELMQKGYIIKLRRTINAELGAIDAYLKRFPEVQAEDVYTLLGEERKKVVVPEIDNDDLIVARWSQIKYTPPDICFGTDVFKTERGDLVRSKSEYMLANMLSKHSIPYKYEKPLYLESGTFYPDFTILDVHRRREIYLEHFGMMDDPSYLDRMLKKVNEYNRAGYRLGDNLIITMESYSQPLDIRAAERMILRVLELDTCAA